MPWSALAQPPDVRMRRTPQAPQPEAASTFNTNTKYPVGTQAQQTNNTLTCLQERIDSFEQVARLINGAMKGEVERASSRNHLPATQHVTARQTHFRCTPGARLVNGAVFAQGTAYNTRRTEVLAQPNVFQDDGHLVVAAQQRAA